MIEDEPQTEEQKMMQANKPAKALAKLCRCGGHIYWPAGSPEPDKCGQCKSDDSL